MSLLRSTISQYKELINSPLQADKLNSKSKRVLLPRIRMSLSLLAKTLQEQLNVKRKRSKIL